MQELLGRHGLLDDYLTRSTQLLSAAPSSAYSSLIGGRSSLLQQQQQQLQQRGWLAGCGGWLASCLCGSSQMRRRNSSSRIFCEPGTAAAAGRPVSAASSAAGGKSAPGSKRDLRSAAGSKIGKKQIWEPGPGEMQPLKTVWSPVAVLLLLGYLAAAGYYLFVRFVTAWDLGNQAW